MEALIAILGAVIGLFIYRFIGQKTTDAGQKKLESAVKENRKKDEALLQKSNEISASESEKVKEIENEQNKDVTVDQLVDFFNNRKGK